MAQPKQPINHTKASRIPILKGMGLIEIFIVGNWYKKALSGLRKIFDEKAAFFCAPRSDIYQNSFCPSFSLNSA